MSTAGAATLAVVRETPAADQEPVTKGEMGTGDASIAAQWTDILAKLVPTGMIAGYSLLITLLIGFIEEPTVEDPSPNEYVPGRIIIWSIFLVLTFVVSLAAYNRRKKPKTTTTQRKFPWELAASTFAFAAWGLATPGNWLEPLFESEVNKALVPTGVGVVSALLLGVFSADIRKKLPK